MANSLAPGTQTYVTNVNAALEKFPEFKSLGLVDLNKAVGTDALPAEIPRWSGTAGVVTGTTPSSGRCGNQCNGGKGNRLGWVWVLVLVLPGGLVPQCMKGICMWPSQHEHGFNTLCSALSLIHI